MADKNIEIQVLKLLEEVLAQEIEQQESFLERQTDISEDIIEKVRLLLRNESLHQNNLQTGQANYEHDDADQAPEKIGAYRILRLIGRGGMGAVYLGERADSSFDHIAAIKIIKSSLVSPELVERFEHERQLLAQLNHENIARLYDGGETETGEPYIIMEYVNGISLQQWTKDYKPDLNTSLGLFSKICSAIAYAHSNLVIHRDLTPSNILVTDNSDVKIIDFGIAKLQREENTDDPVSIQPSLSLTPGYAAPERVQGVNATTVTDIYSLGKILELLIQDNEDAELSAITNKATSQEPIERYQTADALAEEIQNYQQDFPVTAFSEAKKYNIQKFIKRQKFAVAATAMIAVSLIGGLLTTSLAYNQAETARGEAEQRFNEVRELANFQIFDLNDKLTNVVGNTDARVLLAEKAQSYLTNLAATEGANDELRYETARGFIKLAYIQGVPAQTNLGDYKLAKANLNKAESLLESLDKEFQNKARAELSKIYGYLALINAQNETKPEEAKEKIKKSVKTLYSVPKDQRDWHWLSSRRSVRIAQLDTADINFDTKEMTRVAKLLEQDITEWPKSKQNGYEAQIDRAIMTNYLAASLFNPNDPKISAQSLELHLKSDKQFASVLEQWPNDPVALYRRGWNAYYGYGAAEAINNLEQADNLLQQARNSADILVKIDESDSSLHTFAERLIEAQASLFSKLGRHSKAIELQQTIIEGRLKKLKDNYENNTSSDLAYGYATLGLIANSASRSQLACDSFQKSEKHMIELETKDAFSGYLTDVRKDVQAGLQRCEN